MNQIWAWVALGWTVLSTLITIFAWLRFRERQAAERQALMNTVTTLIQEKEAYREALDRSEKARMAAHEAGGADRVRVDLERLRPIGED